MDEYNDTPEEYRTLQHWSISRRNLERKQQQREQRNQFNMRQVNNTQQEFIKNVNISNNPSMVDALNQVRNGAHKDVSTDESLMRFSGQRMYMKEK
jgi:hypothetical protein